MRQGEETNTQRREEEEAEEQICCSVATRAASSTHTRHTHTLGLTEGTTRLEIGAPRVTEQRQIKLRIQHNKHSGLF